MANGSVELGFAVPRLSSDSKLLHENPKWNEWDGGLLGGAPSLLLPLTEPDHEYLLCDKCLKALTFLLQIYAPRDDLSTAFHRSFYVFVCRNKADCLKERGSVKVLRAQCGRANGYYPSTSSVKLDRTDFKLTAELGTEFAPAMLIEVGTDSSDSESEPELEGSNSKQTKLHETNQNPNLPAVGSGGMVTQKLHGLSADAEVDPDAEAEQEDFDEIAARGSPRMRELLNNKDPTFLRFQDAVAEDPDQILRYNLSPNGSALWVSESGKPEDIPVCETCLGRLHFEFQVMPQVLSILQETTLDWGTICVYTCPGGCSPLDKHNYRLEYAWVQHIP